jgi:hypothetical protein
LFFLKAGKWRCDKSVGQHIGSRRNYQSSKIQNSEKGRRGDSAPPEAGSARYDLLCIRTCDAGLSDRRVGACAADCARARVPVKHAVCGQIHRCTFNFQK